MEETTKYVTWDAHHSYAEKVEAEFARRDDENTRQNHRIEDLEANVKEIGRLTVSVERMALSMENMATEQKHQGERLDEIEKKPAKRWDTLVAEVIKYAVAFILGAIIMRFGVAL